MQMHHKKTLRSVTALLFFMVGVVSLSAALDVQVIGPGSTTVGRGSTLVIQGYASEDTGNLAEHWLEIKRPSGQWSWEGWLTSEPFSGGINGDGFSSYKEGAFTFDEVGVYEIRVTAIENGGEYYAISGSTYVTVHPVNAPAVSISVGGSSYYQEIEPQTALSIQSTATDSDGNMSQHWLEIRRPSGQWSWEGWLVGEPYGPALGGNGAYSSKSTTFTFTEYGLYEVRSTAIDPNGVWSISQVAYVYVYDPNQQEE